jgi:hypothetical protein
LLREWLEADAGIERAGQATAEDGLRSTAKPATARVKLQLSRRETPWPIQVRPSRLCCGGRLEQERPAESTTARWLRRICAPRVFASGSSSFHYTRTKNLPGPIGIYRSVIRLSTQNPPELICVNLLRTLPSVDLTWRTHCAKQLTDYLASEPAPIPPVPLPHRHRETPLRE